MSSPATEPADGDRQADLVSQDLIDACGREQIQFLGHVQEFGCLIIVSTQWVISHASGNCSSILGIGADTLIGQRLIDLLPGTTVHTLRGNAQVMGRGDQGIRIFGLDVLEDGRLFDVAIHLDKSQYLIEFEPKRGQAVRNPGAVVQNLLPQLRIARDESHLCAIAADATSLLTGFDRVMVYRFEADFSGLVVGETLNHGAESYMGHRFPASDIPPQARALYTRNLIRIIADCDAPIYPVLPIAGLDSQPVDLSLSTTRAVSPIHLQYLRNMGVRSSMSASIVVEGELWGMIACHHPQPHHVDYETRSAIELFAQLLSYELGLRAKRDERGKTEAAMAVHNHVSMLINAANAGPPDLAGIARKIEAVIPADGIAIRIGEHFHAAGLTPSRSDCTKIITHIAENADSRVFSTDNAEKSFAGLVSLGSDIGGVLGIAFQDGIGNGVLLFRREVTQVVIWAGPPSKQTLADGRLSPRTSFGAWREQRQGFSENWTAAERAAAELLRISLLEFSLHLSADQNRRYVTRNDRQEVVIAELTHRLRNIYATLSAVIEAGAEGSGEAVSTYAGELNLRIAAMMRANEMLTHTDQQATSLRGLILDEVGAYCQPSDGRVSFIGGDADLTAAQCATLTLVIHELTTNAVKYGALGPSGGQLEISISVQNEGVVIGWTERGGPPVVAPDRNGFGSTLIEHVIPHDLGGSVTTGFGPDGFNAVIQIPGLRFVTAEAANSATRAPGDAEDVPVRLSGRGLVVEDNAIIALNAAQTLRQLGASDVVVAPSSEAAFAAMDAGPPFSFALIDQDLGGISSEPIAARLEAENIPFVMASGLDRELLGTNGVFSRAVWVEKPYSSQSIGRVLTRNAEQLFGAGQTSAKPRVVT